MPIDRRLFLSSLGLAALGGCGATSSLLGGDDPYAGYQDRGPSNRVQRVDADQFPDVGFSDWTDAEAEYLLYPGDEIEVATPTAPELTRTYRIGPDGRVSLPLVGQVMAANRSISELEADASNAYASQLRRPVVEVTLRTAGPIRVWVDGEVRTPGVYEMVGDQDAYQALISAGGVLPSGKPGQAALIRRGPGGTRMMRVLDLRPRRGEVVALRRGDIIYIPRSTLAEVAAFITQVRAALPVDFSYAIGGGYARF